MYARAYQRIANGPIWIRTGSICGKGTFGATPTTLRDALEENPFAFIPPDAI